MTTNEEEIKRGHELYLRHLLLLGQAAPLGLKAILEREVSKRQAVNLAQLIAEKTDTFNEYHKTEFLQLFQEDDVTTNIDLWDTPLLCVVILVLFQHCLTTTECEAIACVSDQRKDLENYAHSASLSYNTFETKWDTLHSKMLTLIEGIDDEAKFECKRMIHSFKSEPIRVNRELINRMKQINDVNLHVQMAIEDKVVPTIHREPEDSCDEDERTDHQYDNPVFTENLQDTFVYIDESAILTCKLNVSDKAVIWQKDSKPVEETDKLMVVNKKEMQWLAISCAKLTDSGSYSCVCGNTSTEAFLRVSDRPLTITKDWNVATAEADILNLLRKKQLTEDLFRNWIRGALGLKYLKLGLEGFADNSVKSHHVEIMKGLPPVCTTCTAEFLLPSHTQSHCPKKSKCLCSKQPKRRKLCINGGFCSTFYDRILWDHRFYDPLLANTDVPNWSKEPWSVATCYISTHGYQGKLSAKEVDCSGLLSLFINNIFIHKCLGDVEINGVTDLFKQAKDVRNEILHNATYELSEDQFNNYIDLFKSVLEIKDVNGDSPLAAQPGVQEAVDNLNELRNYQIDQKQTEDLKEHGMCELAEKIEQGETHNRIKLQQLTEELKVTGRNLQLMRDLKSSEAKSKDSKDNRVPTNDFSCGKHQGSQCTWYCSAHDKFCCSACRESDHSVCVGIKQVVSERSYWKEKQGLAFKRKIGTYNVQIKNRLINRDENDVRVCTITSICMIPNGNILLVDRGNHRLKKLDSSYNVVSHCDIPNILDMHAVPNNVCYMGNDRAVVCLWQGEFQFVNVSGSMKLEQVVKLDHPCFTLACHGDTLYVSGVDAIYTYDRDGQQEHVLYRFQDLKKHTYLNSIAVSDDGWRIYIASHTRGLITIDKTGNHLFTLRSEHMENCMDVCVVGDGTVLVLDEAGRIDQIDYSGKQILRTVVNQSDGLDGPVSLCYNRQQCRIIVAIVNGESIAVFELKYHSSGAYTSSFLEV